MREEGSSIRPIPSSCIQLCRVGPPGLEPGTDGLWVLSRSDG